VSNVQGTKPLIRPEVRSKVRYKKLITGEQIS